MAWRARASLTPDEAKSLHREALVIDTLAGIGPDIFSTPDLASRFNELLKSDNDCGTIGREMRERSIRALRTSGEARAAFKDAWMRSGVNVASVTLIGGHAPPYQAFASTLAAMAEWHALVRLFKDWLSIATDADDLETAHRQGRSVIVFNFQECTPFEDKLERIQLFYDLGVRSVQLTYNSINLVGGGKNDVPLGLTRFGVEVVRALNEAGMIIDVSHSSELVGFDAVKYSTAPISANHTSSAAVHPNSQAKGDDLLKLIASKGGFIGVHIVPGYLSGGPRISLDHFADHVEHIARVAGINAVGLGIDQGPYWKLRVPPEIPLPEEKAGAVRGYHWGISEPGTRRCHKVPMDGYRSFEDLPEVTATLARRGFNEDELRKILGLNYLRLFRDVVG
jgi:membrane dipeptidase